jgi:hypothetical protein
MSVASWKCPKNSDFSRTLTIFSPFQISKLLILFDDPEYLRNSHC